MNIENMYNCIICFPLELGAMVASLVLTATNCGLAIWGMVHEGPITVIIFGEYATELRNEAFKSSKNLDIYSVFDDSLVLLFIWNLSGNRTTI